MSETDVAEQFMLMAERAFAQRDMLAAAMREACDLLAERKYGSPARSPGHNARLRLEMALAAVPSRTPQESETP